MRSAPKTSQTEPPANPTSGWSCGATHNSQQGQSDERSAQSCAADRSLAHLAAGALSPSSDPSELDGYGASCFVSCARFGRGGESGTFRERPGPSRVRTLHLGSWFTSSWTPDGDYPSSLILPFHQPRYATHLRAPLSTRDAAWLPPSTARGAERGRGGERGRPSSSSSPSPSCRAASHPCAAAPPDSPPARAGAASARGCEIARRCERRARLHFSEVVVPQTQNPYPLRRMMKRKENRWSLVGVRCPSSFDPCRSPKNET